MTWVIYREFGWLFDQPCGLLSAAFRLEGGSQHTIACVAMDAAADGSEVAEGKPLGMIDMERVYKEELAVRTATFTLHVLRLCCGRTLAVFFRRHPQAVPTFAERVCVVAGARTVAYADAPLVLAGPGKTRSGGGSRPQSAAAAGGGGIPAEGAATRRASQSTTGL